MLALGFQGASCVRVSNKLGGGNARAVKFSVIFILSTSTVIGVFFWILCLAFCHEIAYLFTSNDKVAETVSSLSILLAFSILFNSVQPVLLGGAVGAGWQSLVALVNLGCYYVIRVPFGALLAYVADLSVRGLWIGMLCGVGIQTLALICITWRTNWGAELLTYGRRIPFAELFARIDAVDSNTVKRVANRFIFDRDIAIAAMGPVQGLPDYNWFRRRTYLQRY